MIIFENVKFKYKSNTKQNLFENLSFDIKKHNFCAILGRSGAGKSSILNLIAGIETIYDNSNNFGEIKLRNEIVDSKKCFVQPEKRNLAMIFQVPSLFSHKNVFENIIFGMQKLSMSKSDKKEKVIDFLKKIKMSDYAESFPHQLSIGQQQRIAFARAILSGADIILLDEPFSGLDFESKFLLYNLLLEIKRSHEKTIVLVTHDFDEAAFFANQFLIIHNSKICEYNSIEEIYKTPCSRYTASLFQFSNIFEGPVVQNNKIQTVFGPMEYKSLNCFDTHTNDNSTFNYCVRAEHIRITNKYNGVPARIEEIKFFGSHYILILSTKESDQNIFVKVDDLNGMKVMDQIYVQLNTEKISAFA